MFKKIIQTNKKNPNLEKTNTETPEFGKHSQLKIYQSRVIFTLEPYIVFS